MTLFCENKTAELSPLGWGPLVEWPSALVKCPPRPSLSLPQPQQY